jgi:hypothetical protein
VLSSSFKAIRWRETQQRKGFGLSRNALCDETNIAQEKRKVLQDPRKKLPKWSKGKMSTDVIEAQTLFKQAWPEKRFGFSVKAMITEAYRFMSPKLEKTLTYRRVETIWQGTARRIDGEEKDVLRLAVLQEHRREQAEIRARLAWLDERLAVVDPEFFGPEMEARRTQTNRQGSAPE